MTLVGNPQELRSTGARAPRRTDPAAQRDQAEEVEEAEEADLGTPLAVLSLFIFASF